MRKLLLIVFTISCFNLYSQEKEKISLSFFNASLKDVIEKIEEKTSYNFYFIDSWLKDYKGINVTYTDATLKDILDGLLSKTKLNYYILDTKVILSNNNKIYTSIYNKPIEKESTSDNTVNESAPILIANTNTSKKARIKVVKIGKEGTGSKNRTYKLSGYVYNKTTNLPITDLVILNRSKNIYATTNHKGFYTINLPYGINTVETILSGVDNEKTKIIMYNNGTYNFRLTETIAQLDEVVITADVQKNVKSNVTGVSQIKTKEIKTIPLVLGERDIIKVATTLPGIKSAGEGAQGVNVRGGKSDQNLFLLDNGVLYNPTHFLGLFSAINPFTTNDLKVYKGSIPAEFGGRISSVFDIKSKNSNVDKLTGEASIGPVTSNVSVETPIVKGKSGLMIGARSTYSNWLLKAVDNESLNNSSISFFDIIAKYNHKFNDNNDLKASVYYSSDKYSIASDTTNAYKNRVLSFEWNHKFNDKNNGSLILSSSNYNFDIDYDGPSTNDFILNYNIDEVNIMLKMKYLHSKKHKISYGLSSKLYVISPGSINPRDANSNVQAFSVNKEKALESAIYASDDITLSDKLSVNVGARFSLFSIMGSATQRLYADNAPKNESTVVGSVTHGNNKIYKTYNGLSLRLSSRYSLAEDLSIKGSISNAFQYIHRLTNNTSASPTDIWKLSDPNIKPQEALQGSLGIYKNIDGNKYEISLEGYYKKYNNLLDYKVGASFLLNQYIETEVLQGDGKSYGVELLLKKNSGKLNGWLSYSYSRSLLKLQSEFLEETVNNGNFFPTNFDKPHDLNLIANYKLTKRFSLSANFTYQTGRPITYPIGKYVTQGIQYLLYSDRNKFRIPDYYRLDLGFNVEGNHKKNKLGHSFWNISIYNVLGRNNPYSVFFVTEDGNVKGYQSSIFSRPIPTITYNIKF